MIIESYFKVCVTCYTYNHAAFIADTLRGFVSQKTSFPVIYAIVDDASTDGESEVINLFLSENFNLNDESVVEIQDTADYSMIFAQHKTNRNCFISYYSLKYNHKKSSKDSPRRTQYINRWLKDVDYIAICEGDDFWTNPNKLQKQIDFLDTHPNYTMTCGTAQLFSVSKNRIVGRSSCYEKSQDIFKNDVIEKGGLFIASCTIVYRPSVKEQYPDYCKQCHVGDYPLQIMCSMKGEVYFFDEPMAVYRIENPNSWVGKQKEQNLSEKRLSGILSEIRMLEGFRTDYPQYRDCFDKRIQTFLFSNTPSWKKDTNGYIRFYLSFKNEIRLFPWVVRVKMHIKYLFLNITKPNCHKASILPITLL